MSGTFLQRGEPAMVDKWTRTKMALASGVDIVIELPYVYSTAPATDFAKGRFHYYRQFAVMLLPLVVKMAP